MSNMLHKRHHTGTDLWWLEWKGGWTSPWKGKLYKWPIPSCCPSSTLLFSAALNVEWLCLATSLEPFTEFPINLHNLAWVLRLYSILILPSTMLLQLLSTSIINGTLQKGKINLKSLPVHFIYDKSFYFAVIRSCSFPMSPVSNRSNFPLFGFLVLYNQAEPKETILSCIQNMCAYICYIFYIYI